MTLASTLVGDLGAESIDFLDIVFRLEKTQPQDSPRRAVPRKSGVGRLGLREGRPRDG